MASRYPRTLYKKSENGAFTFTTRVKKVKTSVKYDTLIVENAEEQKEAEMELGYIDNFQDALFHKPQAEVKRPVDEDEEDF